MSPAVPQLTLMYAVDLQTNTPVTVSGIVPNASTGEFAHQQHKRANKSSSNRNAPAHYARHANTAYAFDALADGIPYRVKKYNKSTKKHGTVTVKAGSGCSRLLQALRRDTSGDVVGVPDIREHGTPAPGVLTGKFPGAARWVAPLRKGPHAAVQSGDWRTRASTMRQRPRVDHLLEAYRSFFGCGGIDEPPQPCANSRCPRCWTNPSALDSEEMACSRFKHGAPLKASSGLGRWKGGDIRGQADYEFPDSWAVGEGGGEDVEIWTTPPYDGDRRVDVEKLTMGRILYFFDHEGNPRGNGGTGDDRPITSWVLVFDYVTSGDGKSRLPDKASDHPTMRLRGRSDPVIYPAEAIRRHVHLYHACPCIPQAAGGGVGAPPAAPGDAQWECGLAQDRGGRFGGAKVWRHKYRLAASNKGYDHYLLNEHHHSISQDAFV